MAALQVEGTFSMRHCHCVLISYSVTVLLLWKRLAMILLCRSERTHWAPEQVWNFGEQKNLLSLQGFETRNAQPVSQSLYRLHYPGRSVTYACTR